MSEIIHHTVAPGDTLFGIARKHESTVDAIATANSWLTDIHLVKPGWVLHVPIVASKPEPAPERDGIWLGTAELAALPTSGAAWDNVRRAADNFTANMVDYADQDSTDGSAALAAALVAVRTGDDTLFATVDEALETIASSGYDKRNPSALGWARTLTQWVVAADLIGHDTPRWRDWLTGALTEPYSGDGGSDLLDLTERANNIGALARCAVTAIALAIVDDTIVDQQAALLKQWLTGDGDQRIRWGADMSWHADPKRPVGVNPRGSTKDGRNIDGVIADDQRRAGPFDPARFPGGATKYPTDVIAAFATQQVMLYRAGYVDAPTWGDDAAVRATRWMVDQFGVDYALGSAGGGADDRSLPWLLNAVWGASFPTSSMVGHGRPLNWCNWTHRQMT